MKRLLLAAALIIPLHAQTSVRVTASTLSAATTKAMFGSLPKSVTAAQVLVCSSAATSLTVPLALIQQQLKPSGYTVLAPDVALAVIAAAQGGSKKATALRWSVATVELAAVASTWSGLSMAAKNTLVSSALIGQSSLGIVSTAIPTHTYMTLQTESLPDPLQIAALTCAKPGIALVETDSSVKSVDMVIPVHQIEMEGQPTIK